MGGEKSLGRRLASLIPSPLHNSLGMKLLYCVKELSVCVWVYVSMFVYLILPPGAQLPMVALPPGMGRGLSTHTGGAGNH